MTWSLATGTLRDDEESRAFLRDRLVLLGRVGALFFATVTLLRTVVLRPRTSSVLRATDASALVLARLALCSFV